MGVTPHSGVVSRLEWDRRFRPSARPNRREPARNKSTPPSDQPEACARHNGAVPPHERPLLLIDVDGVLALFNLQGEPPAGVWHLIEGFPYYLATAAAGLLHEAAEHFDLAWCTGWEDRANDHLPRLLSTPGPLPVVYFDRNPGRGNAHWKLDAIDTFAGSRPLAWIDDALDDRCTSWSAARSAAGTPTLLVQTQPHLGLDRAHLDELLEFARRLPG